MQNIRSSCKLFMSLGGVFLIGIWTIVPNMAYAASNGDFENNTTGTNSKNTNEAQVSSSVSINESNQSEVTNRSTFTFTSGNNSIEQNTSVGDIKTGDIALREDVTTTSNIVAPIQVPSSSQVSAQASNTLTGAGSSNINTVDSSYDVTISRSDTSAVVNSVDFAVQTGGNSIARNTTVGNISTGAINAQVNFNTTTNSNPVTPLPTATPTPNSPNNPPTPHATTTTNTQTVSSVPVNRAVTQVLSAMSGVGGADIEMMQTRKFFPAGADINNNLIGITIAGLWLALVTSRSYLKPSVHRKKVAA